MEVWIFPELIFVFFSAYKKSTRFFNKDLSDGNVSSSTTTKKVFIEDSDDSNSAFVEDTDSDSNVYLPTPPLVCTPEKNEATPVKKRYSPIEISCDESFEASMLACEEEFFEPDSTIN